MEETNGTVQHQFPNANEGIMSTSDSLRGVNGWLKFFVVVNLYISPVIFIIQYILAWIGFFILAKEFPAVILVGLIETAVTGFLVWKWIHIARDLRDIKPGVVHTVRTWLKVSLGWVIIDTPLAFLSGMNAKDLFPGAIKGIVLGLIGFAIWYSYFNVSKRVKATYPDWES